MLLKLFVEAGRGGQGNQGQIIPEAIIEKIESQINSNNKNMGLAFGHVFLRAKVLYALERAAISIWLFQMFTMKPKPTWENVG